MRILLLDVNILVAMHDADHPANQMALDWFHNNAMNGWATCPLTENGFMRVYSQTAYKGRTDAPTASFYLLDTLKQTYQASHTFWNDSVSFSNPTLFLPSKVAGHKQITDIYLLGLCQQNGGTLVTLDTGITTAAIVKPHSDLLRLLS